MLLRFGTFLSVGEKVEVIVALVSQISRKIHNQAMLCNSQSFRKQAF